MNKSFFKNNKLFNLDNSGNSKAFFLKKNIPIDASFLNKMEKYYSINKESFRVCLHSSKEDLMQYMVILLDKNYKSPIHYHPKKDEYYMILSGEIEISIYNKKIKKNKKIILNNKQKKVFKIERNTLHSIKVKNSKAIFTEQRAGPFSGKDTVYINE